VRVKKIISVAASVVVLLICSASCSNMESINNLMNSISGTTVPEGKDYITYSNSKRTEILGAYIGNKLNNAETTLLLDNIELTYYKVEGETNTYSVYIDNHDQDYFFDGIVRLVSDSKEYDINVDMIAPGTQCFFDLELEGVPNDYQYYVEGEMYSWGEDLSIDCSFTEEPLDNDTKKMIIIDEPIIDETLLKDFADYLYKRDTINNSVETTIYYLATSEDYIAAGQEGYTDCLCVDTLNQKVEVTDSAGAPVLRMNF